MIMARIFIVLGICMCILFLKWAFCGGKVPGEARNSLGMTLYNLFIGFPLTLYLYWLLACQIAK